MTTLHDLSQWPSDVQIPSAQRSRHSLAAAPTSTCSQRPRRVHHVEHESRVLRQELERLLCDHADTAEAPTHKLEAEGLP